MLLYATEKQAVDHIEFVSSSNGSIDLDAEIYTSKDGSYIKLIDKTSCTNFRIGSQRKGLRRFGSVDSALKFCREKFGVCTAKVKIVSDYGTPF